MACKNCGYFTVQCGLCGVGHCEEHDELVMSSGTCTTDNSEDEEDKESDHAED